MWDTACARGLLVSFTRMPRPETQRTLSGLTRNDGRLPPYATRISALDGDTLAWQLRLARIPAPTGAEQRRATAVAQALSALGCDARLDSAGNVIATSTQLQYDPALAPVVCMAHLDTVFDADTPLTVTHNGTQISCPGIGDNGRGLATMLTLARVLSEFTTHAGATRRRVEFVATVGEEGLGNLYGARNYFDNRALAGEVSPHAVLVLDGPGDANIVHHALGSRRYRITFQGAGGHSWADFGSPNAVHAASRAAAWLADVPRGMQARVAVTVSRIGGGESMNAIPAHASFDVDVRGTDQRSLMTVDEKLREIVEAAVRAERTSTPQHHGGAVRSDAAFAFRHDIVLLGERPCGELPREHALVRIAQQASRLHGVEPVSAVASTDANIPLSMGIPAITIGGGGTGGNAHTVSEWYDNTNGPRGVSRAYAILAALAV